MFFELDFDSQWDDFESIFAVFTAGGQKYVIAAEDNLVEIPWEAAKSGEFLFSVFAQSGADVLTCGEIKIPVIESGLPAQLKQREPTEDAFALFRREAQEECARLYSSRIRQLEQQISALEPKALVSDKWDEFFLPFSNTASVFSPKDFNSGMSGEVPLINTRNASLLTNTLGSTANVYSSPTVFSMRADSAVNMNNFAQNNTIIREINLYNLGPSLTNTTRAFYNCRALEAIGGVIDMTNVTAGANMFYNCTSLREVRFKEESIAIDMIFSQSENLSLETLLNILAALKTGVSRTLYLNRLCKMTLRSSDFVFEDELGAHTGDEGYIAAVRAKGWALSGW